MFWSILGALFVFFVVIPFVLRVSSIAVDIWLATPDKKHDDRDNA